MFYKIPLTRRGNSAEDFCLPECWQQNSQMITSRADSMLTVSSIGKWSRFLGSCEANLVKTALCPKGGTLPLKVLSGFFPKFRSYSVKRVEEGGWGPNPKSFVSKLPNFQMVGLQSWSVCQPVPGGGSTKYSDTFPYKSIGLTLARDF